MPKNSFYVSALLSEAVRLGGKTAIRQGSVSVRYDDERYSRCSSRLADEAEAEI